MTDLQIILIILGFIIIAGVVFYNWCQEKKLRDTIRHVFAPPTEDVLTSDLGRADQASTNEVQNTEDTRQLDSALTETSVETAKPAYAEAMASDAAPVVEAAVKLTETTEAPITAEPIAEEIIPEAFEAPALETTVVETATEEVVSVVEVTPITLPDGVHAIIDLTSVLRASTPVNGHAFHTMAGEAFKGIGAKVSQYGLDQFGAWQLIDDGINQNAAFETVTCSLQLVDRRGPVSTPIINQFAYAIEAIAGQFDASVEWLGEDDPAQRAIKLDELCIEVDQVVSVHLLQGDTPIHGTKFKGLAEANDLKLRDGHFYSVDAEQPDIVKYVLSSADEQDFTPEWLRQNIVRGIVFQIELPKVESVDLVFYQMIIVAQQMSSSLGANMVDHNHKPLGNVEINKIKQQLKVLSSKMIDKGIVPGSASTTRLFN